MGDTPKIADCTARTYFSQKEAEACAAASNGQVKEETGYLSTGDEFKPGMKEAYTFYLVVVKGESRK